MFVNVLLQTILSTWTLKSMVIKNNICYCGHEESCHKLFVNYADCHCCGDLYDSICDGCVDNTQGLDPDHLYKQDNLKFLENMDEELGK